MVSAGAYHACLLCSDGTIVACGRREHGQCEFPHPPEGTRYTQVAAGLSHTVLLRSDGVAITCGIMSLAHHRLPATEVFPAVSTLAGDMIAQVAVGYNHTLLLTQAGTVFAYFPNKENAGGPYTTEWLPFVNIVQVSAGKEHVVLLSNDGKAFAIGDDDRWGQCGIPALEQGIWYTQVSAGMFHTLLLCSDGSVRACGRLHAAMSPRSALWSVQAILDEKVYTKVSAGGAHSMLLRKDGTAIRLGGARGEPMVVWARNVFTPESCHAPPLEEGVTYVDISAGLE